MLTDSILFIVFRGIHRTQNENIFVATQFVTMEFKEALRRIYNGFKGESIMVSLMDLRANKD